MHPVGSRFHSDRRHRRRGTMTTTLAGPSGTTSDEGTDTAVVHGRHIPTGLFIGGAWRSADSTFAVLDPATGEQIAEMSDGGPADAIAALDAAADAQETW